MPGTSSDPKNLWVSAGDGDQEAVERLIKEQGLTPRSPDENGYTPVMAATSWGHTDLLRWLLELDKDAVNVGDSDGDQPMHHLADATDLAQTDLLEPVLKLLLEAGANPLAPNEEGKTPVDTAKESDPQNLEFIKMLMSLRPDLGIEMPPPEEEETKFPDEDEMEMA